LFSIGDGGVKRGGGGEGVGEGAVLSQYYSTNRILADLAGLSLTLHNLDKERLTHNKVVIGCVWGMGECTGGNLAWMILCMSGRIDISPPNVSLYPS